MIDNDIQNSGFSYGNFVWWFGVIEKRDDPKRLGRVRVRVLGYHSPSTSEIEPDKLLWAYPMQPIISSATSGIGISPTGIVEGTWVFGFFRDGSNAQDPIIMGTAGGIPESIDQHADGDGFKDPDETYPRAEFLEESDVNRLAKNDDEEPDKMKETTLKKQQEGETQKVPIALEGMSRQDPQPKQHKKDEKELKHWTEKVTTYNALYPFNHVRETERGHQEEWDDTKEAERYRRWHRCGTFTEEHSDGDVVKRVKRNKYDLIMGENFVQVIGDCSITIGAGGDFGEIEDDKMDWGDNVEKGEQPWCKDVPEVWDEKESDKKYLDKDEEADKYKKEWKKERKVDKSALNLLVKGDVNLEVEGDWYQKVHGDYELYVMGEIREKSVGIMYHDAELVHHNKPGPELTVESIDDPDWDSNKKGREEEKE